MTREEALEFGNLWLELNEDCEGSLTYGFFRTAIKALEQEPCEKDWRFYFDHGYAQAKRDLSCEDAISRKAMLELQAKYAEDMGATKFWQMSDDIKALPPVIPQPKEKEFAKFNDFYPEDRGTYPPAGKEILIKNHNGDNFIAYLDYDDAEDGGWGFYSENGDFIADVNEIDAWMLIPQHERDKNYIPMQERKINVLTSNIEAPGTDEEEEIWQI